MAKLVVNESNDVIILDRSPVLKNLLEAKNESGLTALLIACNNKDYNIVELLVEAGADAKVLDQQGNTAIILAASSPAQDEIPSPESSPAIYKVCFIFSKCANDFK